MTTGFRWLLEMAIEHNGQTDYSIFVQFTIAILDHVLVPTEASWSILCHISQRINRPLPVSQAVFRTSRVLNLSIRLRCSRGPLTSSLLRKPEKVPGCSGYASV